MKNISLVSKGFLIGLAITLILILVSSYRAPRFNYEKEQEQYQKYTSIIQSCGTTPSDSCLMEACIAQGSDSFSCSFYPKQWHNDRQIKSFYTGDKPHLSTLLWPNLRDGLSGYLMAGAGGVIILLLPIIVGLLLGAILGKKKHDE
ncbi:MAG: hypothetical protein V1704_01895 [Candidatus Vogelbacteria bacterium]